jgi:hypothetical protein
MLTSENKNLRATIRKDCDIPRRQPPANTMDELKSLLESPTLVSIVQDEWSHV